MPAKLTIDGIKQDPIMGGDTDFIRMVQRVAEGEDPSSVLKREAGSLVQRGVNMLKAKAQDLGGTTANSISDLLKNRSNVELALPDRRNSLEANATALIALAALTGNQAVTENVERAAKVAKSAAQAYKAMELAAAATTGVGMFVSFAGVLDSTSSLNGSRQNEGEQTLLAIQQLFDYLKLQFIVVNGKLDYIISSLDRIEGKVDQIGEALAGVVHDVRSIDGRLEQLKRTIEQNNVQLARAIWSASLSQCEGLVQGGGFASKETFIGCMGAFISFGEWSSQYPFVIATKDAQANEINNLLSEKNSDAITYSRYSPLVTPLISDALKGEILDCPTLFANGAVIWTAAQYLTLMANQKPNWFVVDPPLMSRFEALSDQARAAERQSECLKGRFGKTLGRRLWALQSAYRDALNGLRDIVQALNREAAERFVNDVLAATAATGPTKIAPWTVAVPTSDPRAPALGYCAGEKPPAGNLAQHEFDKDWVAKLPKYFSKSHEILFARGPAEKRNRLFLCLQDDKTKTFEAHYPGYSFPAAAIDTNIQLMIDDRWLGSVRTPIEVDKREGNCANAIECINAMPKLRGVVYDTILRLLQQKEAGVLIMQNLHEGVLTSQDEELRQKYAQYLQIYIRNSDKFQSVRDQLNIVDNRLALLKYFAVIALPQWWASQDAWRLLLDGDAGTALLSASTFDLLVNCEGIRLCNDPELRAKFEMTPPFWWEIQNGEPSPLEQFGQVSSRPLDQFIWISDELLGNPPGWDEPSEPSYHPLSSAARVRFDVLAHTISPPNLHRIKNHGKIQVEVDDLTESLLNACVQEGALQDVPCANGMCYFTCQGTRAESLWGRMDSIGAATVTCTNLGSGLHCADPEERAELHLGEQYQRVLGWCSCRHIVKDDSNQSQNKYDCSIQNQRFRYPNQDISKEDSFVRCTEEWQLGLTSN